MPRGAVISNVAVVALLEGGEGGPMLVAAEQSHTQHLEVDVAR